MRIIARASRSGGGFQFGDRDAEFSARREEDRALYEIFELANIAGPGISGECLHRFGGNKGDGFVEAPAEFLDEIANEQGDIFRPLTESGDVNGENVEAVIE